MPKTPRYTAKEIIKLLQDDGWFEVSQNGSHKKFRHNTKAGIVVVPMHDGNVKIGTQSNILKQAGLKQGK
jgi:predicted RNA binding protein YcfA (HicA-like mRNA interferase family)